MSQKSDHEPGLDILAHHKNDKFEDQIKENPKPMTQAQNSEFEEAKNDHQSYLALKKSGDHLHVKVGLKAHQ